jgi:hypothetical protein
VTTPRGEIARCRSLRLGLLLALLLGGAAGCSTLGSFTGAAAGIATSAATANPAVAIAVGVGTKAATDAAMKSYSRRNKRIEQDLLAATVGEMSVGEARPWEYLHPLGFGSERGEIRVTRLVETPLALCKEVLFSVDPKDSDEGRAWFAGSACRQADKWKWAAAEPAVERWGNLQ